MNKAHSYWVFMNFEELREMGTTAMRMEYKTKKKDPSQRMRIELIDAEQLQTTKKQRLPIVAYLMGYSLQFTGRSRKERRIVKRVCPKAEVPTFEKLKELYEKITHRLDKRYIDPKIQTHQEIRVTKQISCNTKLQYKTAMWIGSRNIDIFLPMIGGTVTEKGKRHNGLALEVNGLIHNSTLKMKKDIQKENLLHSLGIAVMNIENTDIHHPQVRSAMRCLKKWDRLDSRARKRVLSRVFIETVMTHASDAQLSDLFGVDFKKIQEDYQNQLKGV